MDCLLKILKERFHLIIKINKFILTFNQDILNTYMKIQNLVNANKELHISDVLRSFYDYHWKRTDVEKKFYDYSWNNSIKIA